MAELCRRFGISRDTGYKWLKRFTDEGPSSLADRSTAPHTHPNATPEATLEFVAKLRAQQPTLGPLKLLQVLRTRHPDLALPSASTVGEFLRREGLTVPRRRVRRAPPTGDASRRAPPMECNETWATDFKGQFRVGDGRYCYPLTIQDSWSRLLVRCHGLAHPRAELAKPVFEAAFREFGLPLRMHSDNGSPFAAVGLTGLTKLSAWWVKLGIEIVRSRPGKPQDNGRLERTHRTVQEATHPPKATLRAQARALEEFRHWHNHERPHQALGQQTPASIYVPSPRPWPGRIPSPDYPRHLEVRRVADNGEIRLRGYEIAIGKALAGELVGSEQSDDGVWSIRFYGHRLALFDEATGLLTGSGYRRRLTKRTRRPV